MVYRAQDFYLMGYLHPFCVREGWRGAAFPLPSRRLVDTPGSVRLTVYQYHCCSARVGNTVLPELLDESRWQHHACTVRCQHSVCFRVAPRSGPSELSWKSPQDKQADLADLGAHSYCIKRKLARIFSTYP